MQRVDDRKHNPYDRRKYTAWCGVWCDEDGSLYQRTLMWHPLFWWDIFRPLSMWRGMRLQALRSFWRSRKTLISRPESHEDGLRAPGRTSGGV